jgi:hypothetical protein
MRTCGGGQIAVTVPTLEVAAGVSAIADFAFCDRVAVNSTSVPKPNLGKQAAG